MFDSAWNIVADWTQSAGSTLWNVTEAAILAVLLLVVSTVSFALHTGIPMLLLFGLLCVVCG